MRGQKRVLKGVHARLRRAMDARERAYDPRIHQKKSASFKPMDCRVKPGNDGGWVSADSTWHNLR
jgi:hypothetical protein